MRTQPPRSAKVRAPAGGADTGAGLVGVPLGQIGAGAGCWLARLRSELSDERDTTE